MTVPTRMQYDFTSLKNATATFCSGILVANNSVILHNLISPDCKYSNHNKETKRGITQCMESLLEIQAVILKFEAENCSLRRGVKINEKEEKTRLLLMPLNGTMPFRLGFILHWECGILIHVCVVEDPWQGFLDELSASEENRKLNQQSTNSLKKSVCASHHSWRRISDVVVDAYLINLPVGKEGVDGKEEKEEEEGGEKEGAGQTVVRLCDDSNTNTTVLELPTKSDGNTSIEKTDALDSNHNHHAQESSAKKNSSIVSFDENIFNSASILDEIEIDVSAHDNNKDEVKVGGGEDTTDDKKKIRFDTTINALLIAERCELSNDDLFYNSKELKAFQFDLNNEMVAIQSEHHVKVEVAMKIYFCNSPAEIEEVKSKYGGKKGAQPYRKSITHINTTALTEAMGGGIGAKQAWYHNFPIPRLVRAIKRNQQKKQITSAQAQSRKSSIAGPSSLTDPQTSSSLTDIESQITEIRASSFGSSLRGRDPEAIKFVITVKVLCCVNLSSRNPSFNKLRAMNISVKVQVGKDSFETPIKSRKNPIFSDSTFLFSVSLEEAMHGNILFTIYSTATKKNVVGALRIPFVAVKTRYDSAHPSRIIVPVMSNDPDIKSVGKGFYCISRDGDGDGGGDDRNDIDHASDTSAGAGAGAGGGVEEDAAFLKHMYQINRLSTSSLNYDVDKLPKMYVEITKVDVSGQK